jgi:hypothetical protein
MVLQNELAKASPEFWQFGIGLSLIVVVLVVRRGTFAYPATLRRLLSRGVRP